MERVEVGLYKVEAYPRNQAKRMNSQKVLYVLAPSREAAEAELQTLMPDVRILTIFRVAGTQDSNLLAGGFNE